MNRSLHIKPPRDMQMRFQGCLGDVLFLYLANTHKDPLIFTLQFQKQNLFVMESSSKYNKSYIASVYQI